MKKKWITALAATTALLVWVACEARKKRKSKYEVSHRSPESMGYTNVITVYDLDGKCHEYDLGEIKWDI